MPKFSLYYDLFIFDLDGTLINTEKLHWMAYNKAFKFYNIDINLTFNEYCKYAHQDDISMKNLVSNYTDISYSKIYSTKKDLFLELLDNSLEFIDGAYEFLNFLFENNKLTCIVTHSDKNVLEKVLSKLDILNKVNLILTRDDYTLRKPHPDGYLKALSHFPQCNSKKIIGFEDSYKGYMALSQTSITPVYIGSPEYYYYTSINPINSFLNFNSIDWDSIIIPNNKNHEHINNCISKYISSLQNCTNNFIYIMDFIIPIIQSYINKGHIYLAGIGKCGHISRKCASTWQSLGIPTHYLSINDLFHGDFGILNSKLEKKDIIIYLSNSGNTKELIDCTNYVNTHFKILQICLTLNKDCDVKKYVDFIFNIGDSQSIIEIDSLNMAPTTSSMLFMTFLDIIGTRLSDLMGLTVEKFKLTHPGGDLGKMKNEIIDHVVIACSGHSKRLMPLTNYIPKVVLEWNGKPFIEYLIEYWRNYSKSIIIICLEQHLEIIKFYTNKYTNIKFIVPKNIEDLGTANRIHSSLTNEYYSKNILLTWCDILPNISIDLNKLEKSTIFSYGNECRYGINNNKIVKKPSGDGNIIGIYYLKNYRGFNIHNIGDDICDVFEQNIGDFITYEITNGNLIDIGDIPKFRKSYKSKLFQTRFFNDISILDNNTLLKKAVNTQGIDLITKEINWYKYINNKFDFIPKVILDNNSSFKMEYLDAKPLYLSFNTFDTNKKIEIIREIFYLLSKLHNLEKINKNLEKDLEWECYNKVIHRIKMINPVINYFGKIKTVNNLQIFDLDLVLKKCYNKILDSLNNSNNVLIHGDCQFSNILYNSKLYLIDPRGYFGTSELFGPKEYDYAKILYALSGYDEFNNCSEYYILDISKENITIDIKNNLDLVGNFKEFDETSWAFLVIIWLSYAQYIMNNPLKCVSAYYYGLYLFSKYML
jgi:beta-phosphoglucomutase-like phosphatase (HAD superfamily)/D-arabinose 5-phosphate isomerase GutQ/choline kinase